MIAATCATIAALIATSPPGSQIRLQGNCDRIEVRRAVSPTITIIATGATVRGLFFRPGAAGFAWRGGTLSAPLGEDGNGPNFYAAQVDAASSISFSGVLFTNAGKLLVLNDAVNINVQNSRFELGGDGVVAAGGRSIRILRNTFVTISTRPTQCTIPGVSAPVLSLSSVACGDIGGTWLDGWHADAVQYRDGIVNLTVSDNDIEDVQQGIGNMDAVGDLAGVSVVITNNRVRVSGFHSITDYRSIPMVIQGNTILQATAGQRSPIRAIPSADVVVCGNVSPGPNDLGTRACEIN